MVSMFVRVRGDCPVHRCSPNRNPDLRYAHSSWWFLRTHWSRSRYSHMQSSHKCHQCTNCSLGQPLALMLGRARSWNHQLCAHAHPGRLGLCPFQLNYSNVSRRKTGSAWGVQAIQIEESGSIGRRWECLPLNSLSAAKSGVRPSSVSSILSVILGLNLLSSSYPGVYIVGGKKMWTSMPYSNISEWRVSARPSQHVNVSRAILNLGPTPQCVLRRRVRRPSHERHESEGWRNKSDFSLSVLFHHHLWDCLRLLSGLAG